MDETEPEISTLEQEAVPSMEMSDVPSMESYGDPLYGMSDVPSMESTETSFSSMPVDPVDLVYPSH